MPTFSVPRKLFISQDLKEKTARQKRIKENYVRWLRQSTTKDTLLSQNDTYTGHTKEKIREKRRTEVSALDTDFTGKVMVREMRFLIQAQILANMAKVHDQWLHTNSEGLDLQTKEVERQLRDIHDQLCK
jgi:hypothetical protein